ncbi:hypothetical protein SanaruYs_22070 [Chryseotalea sanaruensis]|uniref:Fibronectin type-III domain-containing protein n=2 Tax=Chryseotalea sanaruensis TaxID=2482724 RepID=A0A401UAN7_9BACT|nr:hypothetical protein SanaruYs_22070 [Chryseotalea sanaruensis]
MVLSLSLKAQVFPVQGNVVLNPPYSPYMADLTALGSQRFWLTLRLQDPTINTYNCKLRLTIEGVGITIRTKNTFLPQPITLEGGGIPQFFYGDDLVAYFNPANLDFVGLTRSQYERTQRLPEGVYRFTIEVLDYNRGTLVSNKIGTTAWIVLNDPPLLNLPHNDTKIAILEPTNIAFTWTPRHTGSPNAAFTTNYTFKMVELAPNATSQSANAAFLSQPVLYETTLSQNQLVYGPAEPTLMAGRKYAWQVQATDTEDRDLFRNNGKSEVFVFQYGDALGIPRNVLQQGGNATTLSMQWELPSEGEMPAQYRIRYKPLSSPANNYFESVTTNRYYTLGELNPSTNYLVQVRSERNSIFSEYSAPLQMSTTSLEDGPYTCGQAPVLTPPTTTEILPRLFPGDEIRMHDFRMMVLTVEGSNGYFSGTGLMPVSLFNNASVKVRFSGKVNKNHELAGEIVSTYAKGNAMGQLVEEMEKIGADRNTAQNNASETIAIPVAITIIGIIDSVWVQDSTIVVLKEDGTQEEITRPVTASGAMQSVVLTDSEGNSYTVNKDGEVINNGSSATSTVASTVHYKVNFTAKEDQDYGFDAKVHEVLNHYETTSIEGDTYTVPWKSVETGRFDKVKVTATVPRENLIQEVGFSVDAASLPKQQGENANELIVTLQGKAHEQAEQVSAYLNQENTADSTTSRLEVGKLNVISYNKAYKNLVLISVNGAQLPVQKEVLQTELNDIYKQAIVQWQVEPVQTLTEIDYDKDNNGLEYGNSNWFSNYTGEMRTIINTYLQNRSLMPDTYYLFIVPKTDDPQVMGFMPRMKQIGFICSEKVTAKNITKTIAHELAHGAFRLEHTFPLLPQQGDNLMDYSANGKNLFKTQWDYIHNPVAMLGLFDSDEEGAMALPCWGWFDDCDDVIAILNGIKSRVGLPLPSLPLYKPDPSRNRGSEYVGYSIELGGETYAKITIKNEIKRDTVIRAENYLDYESQEGGKTYVGFMYKPNDESYFKILLSNEENTVALGLKREKLRNYIYKSTQQGGNDGNESSILDFDETSYVVYRSNANIREKISPYNLLSPESFLEKGKEVELISILVEGSDGRVIVKCDGAEYCTWVGNLKKIIPVEDNEEYKIKKEQSPITSPYSVTNANINILKNDILSISHECGIYRYVRKKENTNWINLGWVKNEDLKKYVNIGAMSNTVFRQKYLEASIKAITDITEDWRTDQAACNLCVRAALLNFTGDDVLFPSIGSSLTILDNGEQIYGKVEAGDGSAQGIIDDLKNGKLNSHFEEIERTTSEDYSQFWTRIQSMVDNNKQIIIGAHDPGHVFLVVPGGLHQVVDNTARENSRLNLTDTKVELGDKWGGSFHRRHYNLVLRIMDCGAGVKFSDGPMYGVMEGAAVNGEKANRVVKFYKYKL